MCHLTFIKLSKDAGGFMVDICGHYNFFGYLLMQVGVKDFYLICSTFIRRKYFHCFKNFLSFRNNMECCLGCLYYIYIYVVKKDGQCVHLVITNPPVAPWVTMHEMRWWDECMSYHGAPGGHIVCLFWLHIYYAHLTSVGFEHCVSWIT